MRSADPPSGRLTALTAVDHLPAQRYALAREACELAGVTAVAWRHKAPLTLGNEWPVLVIAGLPSGARRLPPELNALLNERFPRLPLLLLCEEALVRPTVVTQGGRVVLVGAPLTCARVVSRIRMLTANARAQQSGPWQQQSPGGADWDRLSARHWVGYVRRGAAAAPALVSDGTDGSLMVLLPLEDDTGSSVLLQHITQELARTAALSRKEEALTELLGDRYAALHLPQSGEQWTIYRTGEHSSLRLCSPQRLPRLWDHPHASTQSKLFVKRAASGDVMVMSNVKEISPWNDPSVDLWVGGPGLLASFVEDASAREPSQSTLVVEVL